MTVKGERIMLKEYKVVAEDLLCDTQERNDIQNEDQNNVNKNDGFIAKSFDEVSKMKEDIINELSNVRHTEIKERLTPRKIQTVGMNDYNEFVYPTAK